MAFSVPLSYKKLSHVPAGDPRNVSGMLYLRGNAPLRVHGAECICSVLSQAAEETVLNVLEPYRVAPSWIPYYYGIASNLTTGDKTFDD